MKNKIKQILKDRADKMFFNEDNHTYFLGSEQYTSVSNTLTFFNKGIENIPNIQFYIDRGNWVHNKLESLINVWMINSVNFTMPFFGVDKEYEHSEYINNGIKYLNEQLECGWEILSTEQLMYDIPEKIAGTADLLLYKEFCSPNCDGYGKKDKTSYEDCDYCGYKNIFNIKIVDWKTGATRISHYAQIGIYKYLLKKSLGKALNEQITIETELVSLKP